MSCEALRNSLSEYLDDRLAGEEWTRVARHLAECRECEARFRDLSGLRDELRSMAPAAVPSRLRTQLQVLASRERARWNATRTLPVALRYWSVNIKLAIDNLMRPLAVPLAGGLASALLLFGLLVPTLGFKPVVMMNDVPTRFYTAATLIEAAPTSIHEDEAVVAVLVDARGQAMDYSVQQGQVSPQMQADLTQLMVFSRFTPATWFGQPTIGKVLVSFRRINYVVRG